MQRYNLRKYITPTLRAQEAQLNMSRQLDEINIEELLSPNNDNPGDDLYSIDNQNLASGDNLNHSNVTSPSRTQHTNMDQTIIRPILQTLEEFKEQVLSQFKQTKQEIEKVRKDLTLEIRQIESKFDTKITELREEVHNHIEERITMIQENQERINKEFEAKLKAGNSGKPVGLHITCPSTIIKDLPKFNGKSKNPNQFLSRLKNYYNRENERRLSQDEQSLNLEEILDVCLEGTAARWWDLIRTSVHDIEDFEKYFMNKYWNEEIQDGIKTKLDLEKYIPRRGLTRTEYFIDRVILLQNMTPKLTEREIVRRLVRHFDDTIQQASRVQNIVSINQMEELLSREDTIEINESIRNEAERNVERRSSYSHRPSGRNMDQRGSFNHRPSGDRHYFEKKNENRRDHFQNNYENRNSYDRNQKPGDSNREEPKQKYLN